DEMLTGLPSHGSHYHFPGAEEHLLGRVEAGGPLMCPLQPPLLLLRYLSLLLVTPRPLQ
ncbi:hypothetical protein P7K49_023847, partial [Saguinus oedipus]